MPAAKQWRIPVTCPACNKGSAAEVNSLGHVMRCPHCRTRVVVDRDGARLAPKEKKPTPVAASPRSSKPKPTKRRRPAPVAAASPRLQAVWTAIGLLAGAGLLIAVWCCLPTSSSGGDSAAELRRAAEAFQLAWLAQDDDAARGLVAADDQSRYPQWSAPRRAALTSGFGQDTSGRVTDVEIVRHNGERANVRVAFEVRGRKQQVFQEWIHEADGWRRALPSASH